MDELNLNDNIIDSRDIIQRIEDLRAQRDSLQDEINSITDAVVDARDELDDNEAEDRRQALEDVFEGLNEDLQRAVSNLFDFDAENHEEVTMLSAINDEGQGYGDWEHGTTLIRETHFIDYCRELVVDIGAMPRDFPDYIVIDWEATADNLKVDYTTVDINGTDYYYRA
jgi:hypothetical protein